MLIGLLTGCKTPQGTNWQSSTQKLNLQCNQIKLEVFQTISNNELSSACMAADEKLNIYRLISSIRGQIAPSCCSMMLLSRPSLEKAKSRLPKSFTEAPR